MIAIPITFLSGQSLSRDSLFLDNARHLVGLVIPAGFVGATMTFLGSAPVPTPVFLPIFDRDGGAIEIAVAPGRLISLPADLLLGAARIQFQAAGAQAADAVVQAVLRVYS